MGGIALLILFAFAILAAGYWGRVVWTRHHEDHAEFLDTKPERDPFVLQRLFDRFH